MTTPFKAMETGQDALRETAQAIAAICSMGMEITRQRALLLEACAMLYEDRVKDCCGECNCGNVDRCSLCNGKAALELCRNKESTHD